MNTFEIKLLVLGAMLAVILVLGVQFYTERVYIKKQMKKAKALRRETEDYIKRNESK